MLHFRTDDKNKKHGRYWLMIILLYELLNDFVHDIRFPSIWKRKLDMIYNFYNFVRLVL